MPTILTHAVSGLAIGNLYRSQRPRSFWIWTAVCAMLPDADVIAFPLGIPYGHLLGHRGVSHSLAAAAVIGMATALLMHRRLGARPAPLAVYFALVTASHGVLDALTTGGPGVAFFAPFDTTRYFFPWRPIPVSPLASHFFSEWGWRVFRAEVAMIWLPAGVLMLLTGVLRRH